MAVPLIQMHLTVACLKFCEEPKPSIQREMIGKIMLELLLVK